MGKNSSHGTRVDRTKISLGGASDRKHISKGCQKLLELKLIKGKTIDYGCGYGFDAITNNWDRFDPYYHDIEIETKYDTVTCINVLSAVSTKVRKNIIENIQDILKDDGNAYFVVPRNLPKSGKYSGYHRRPQTYVILTLESVYNDKDIEIYKLNKTDEYKDKTIPLGEDKS